MEELAKELNDLYQAAKDAGLCHNQTQFAELVRKDRSNISNALNGSRINRSLVYDVKSVLQDKGLIIENSTVAGRDVNGIDPKKFSHEDQWFAILERRDMELGRRDAEIAEKDKQIAVMQEQITALISRL